MNKKVLFCGLSVSAQSWYRCGLPATYLQQDWLGIVNGPPNEGIPTGGNMAETQNIDVDQYDIMVLQIARGENWKKFIKQQQKRGTKFLYEVDDFLHGVRRVKNHSNASGFNKKAIKDFQEIMSVCDGMICSTDYLSEQYSKYNQNQFVAKNALDFWRYQVNFPENDKIVIGWSGGTGHDSSVLPALRAVNRIMNINEDVIFVSAGTQYAQAIEQFHPGRTKIIPWTSLENYPYVLSYFDISIAPGHESKYHLSKSDLRWIEASAVGIPVVGDPRIYKEIEDGKTGLLAQEEEEYFDHLAYLIDKKEGESRRTEIATAAKKYVNENRNMETQASQWEKIFTSI
jgi:glycosyltransferase involved in cell wall biosynthesis